jgi:general secretion pathway protein C
MKATWWAFGLWAAVAASAVAWGLKLFVPGTPVPANAGVAALAASPRGDLTRLLGADPVAQVAAAPPASARFQLIGVVAGRGPLSGREGVALIATDGRPAKVYRVGAVVEGATVLQTVSQRGALLGPRDGAATVALDIPPLAAAATGALPQAAGFPAAVAAPQAGVPPAPQNLAPPQPVQSMQRLGASTFYPQGRPVPMPGTVPQPAQPAPDERIPGSQTQ